MWSPARERERVPELLATMLRTEPHAEARRTYARALAIMLGHLSMTMSRSRLEPMFARLREACDLLGPSSPDARRWYSLPASYAATLFEPAPWRAQQAAEESLLDARLAGDRYIEHWILVAGHELHWWQLGDAAAEGRLRPYVQGAIHPKSPTLQAAAASHLARIACDTGDPAALAEGARQMRLIAEDPHGGAFAIGLAYELWARIELREGRPAAALAERGRAVLAFAPIYGLGATATLVRALVVEGRAADAARVADEGLAVVAELGGAGHREVEMRLAASEACFAASDGERARAELRETLDQIRIRAEDIADLGWRRSYLTRNSDVRRARALAEAWGVDDPTAALLAGV
jgi:hypothetical protein